MKEDRRFIEEIFPITEISEYSSIEKSSRSNNISSLHIWWARKPHSASRTSQYASLIPFLKSGTYIEKNLEFIKKMGSNLHNIDLNFLKVARSNLMNHNNGKKPRILDPFGGGGTIPFEACILGCEVYASDYNPVSVIIMKCAAEYPQKYANKFQSGLASTTNNKFVNDIQHWGDWVFNKAIEELKPFYPQSSDYIDVAYIWTRTIPCQNPSCKAIIPLINQYWLENGKNKKISLFPIVKNKKVFFSIMGAGYSKFNDTFDPNKGNVSNASAECFVCGFVVDGERTKTLFREKKDDQELIAIVSQKKGSSGKKYRVASNEDKKIFEISSNFLIEKTKKLFQKWTINPVPDEFIYVPLNRKYKFGDPMYKFNPIVLYGVTTLGDFFNSRQKLSLIIFVDKVRDAYAEMKKDGISEDYAKAIVSFLALGIDRLADFNSTMCIINPLRSAGISSSFGRVALQMMWTYAESNPLSPFGASWAKACEINKKWVEFASKFGNNYTTISSSSATSLPYPDNHFDAIFTDPPYYDMVPYSMLSDFFYVWLKRTLREIFPELFSTFLTPKSQEVINEVPLLRRVDKKNSEKTIPAVRTAKHFEEKLSESFTELCRVLKPNGIILIVYAHSSTIGWENVINSLLNSGLVVTASWPINTEMKKRLRAQDSATLASAIYMVARKLKKTEIGYYRDVKKELFIYLEEKLKQLWDNKIIGSDLFIAAIGSAISVFGRYKKIVDDADNIIPVSKLLIDTRNIVTNYAIKKVLGNEFTDDISTLTRFYILWRWSYKEAKVPYDMAIRLSQSTGINLESEINKGFIIKDKEDIRVLGPDERDIEDLKKSHDLIDILHLVLIFWKNKKKEEYERLLKEKGYDRSDIMRKIGIAISHSLPEDSKEKKWLDGFLTGFRQDDLQNEFQSKLF